MSEERLRKIVRKLERQMRRSEQARQLREHITDQQQIMLRKMGRDLKHALHMVERQNLELSDLAEQLEKSLLEAGENRARAEAASRAKSRFVSDMSHDLRTPINALLGMLELLETSGLNGVQSQYMKVIHASAENVLGLTESVLDMRRIEQGLLVLEEKPLDLHHLLERVCRVASPEAQARRVEIICLPERDLPSNLLGDERRLQQVLVSLVASTIHRAQGGELVLRARPDPTFGPGGILVEVVRQERDGVSDGMWSADREPRTEEQTGLATARQLLSLMGSDLCENQERGIRFSFRLRLGLQGAEPRLPVSLNAGEGKRVLVASASHNMRLAIQGQLESWGAEVLAVASAREVEKSARHAESEGLPVSLAVLDGDLGDGQGADVAMRLRFGVLKPPRVYLLSALEEMASMSDRVRRMSLAGVLLKPVVRGELLAALDEVGDVSGGAAGSEPDLRGVRVLIAEDNPANLMVLELYLEDTGCAIDSAADGREALERFSENGADIVLMDIQMPVMDGYEATRSLRRFELENGQERTPVVAVTADAFAHDRVKALASGCDEYMVKPIRRTPLLETIARYTGRV